MLVAWYDICMEGAYDVITVGTATLDSFYPLPSDSFVCEAGAKLEVGAPLFASGGGAVNAAATFARQGLSCAALFRVGADRAGADIIADIEKEGIEAWDAEAKDEATGQSVILLSPSGERTILTHRGASESLPVSAVPFGKIKARWLYIAPSHIDPAVIGKIVNHAYAQGIAIALNPSAFYLASRGAHLKPLLSRVKMLMVNREEGAELTGVKREDERGIFRALDDMVDGIAVLTDGPRGSWVSDGTRLYQAGIFPNQKILDRTGAGDAFGSGFVAGMIGKEDIPYAIRLASANAAANVEAVGAHAGILSRSAFEKSSRWKKFAIEIHAI